MPTDETSALRDRGRRGQKLLNRPRLAQPAELRRDAARPAKNLVRDEAVHRLQEYAEEITLPTSFFMLLYQSSQLGINFVLLQRGLRHSYTGRVRVDGQSSNAWQNFWNDVSSGLFGH